MNVGKLTRSLLTLGSLAMLNQVPLKAQSWITVDDFSPGNGSAITSDSQGNIYAAGSATDTQGVGHAVVMRSADGGASWGIVQDFSYLAGMNTSFLTVGSDSAGNIYAAGGGFTVNNANGQSGYWIVRKSSDQGMTWATVDRFALPGGTYSIATANSFAADSARNLYVAGTATVTQGGSQTMHWIVRKSSDGGNSWTTVDDFLYTGDSPQAKGVVCTASGVLVAGGGYKSFSVGKLRGKSVHWLVRRSTNGGANWTTVDDYQYLSNQTNAGFARAITANAAGDIYLVGNGSAVSAHQHWLTRKSSDGGTTWFVVDDYLYQGNTCVANAAGVDAFGNIYAVGTGANHWLVRASAPSGTAWSLVDDFKYSAGNYASVGFGFGASPNGTAFAIGMGVDASSGHWIVRAAAP